MLADCFTFILLYRSKRFPKITRGTFEMFIYTDRILPMRTWNRERVLVALQGLRRLISIHGPIKITEHMIGENQVGDVKVWISENPVNNHPDSKYMSEEQSMGEFAAILTKKNKQLANFLMGCITLKKAFECLSQQHLQSHSPHHNQSHRASGSGDFRRRLQIKGNILVTPYKNVSGSPPDNGVTKVQGPITPKNPFKDNFKYPQSLFLFKQSEKIKPVSQMNDLNKYRGFLIPKRKIESDNRNGNKSISKLNANDKLNETSYDLSKRSADYFLFNNSHSNKSFAFQHRFQTVSGINPPTQDYFSPKNGIETNWSDNNQIKNAYSSQSLYQKEQKRQNGFKEQKVKAGGFDITIINNNVNNYISNITHNHITKVEKTEKDCSQPKYHTTHQFNNYSRMADHNNMTHNSNQCMKQSQKTREKHNIPAFLQQKKPRTKWAQESAKISQKIKNNNFSRKNTVSSNPSFESPQFSSENNLDRILQDSDKCSPVDERFLRSLNFSKDNESSMSTQKMTSFFNQGGIYPLTPTPASNGCQGFTSFQKCQNNFYFQIPLRTKTMQFYQKVKGSAKNEEFQNKSFTITELQKGSNVIKVNDKKGQSISAHLHSKPQNKKNFQDQQQLKKLQNKLQFKKQLSNQFKNLLGGDTKQKQQQPVIMALPLASIEQKTNAKQTLEGNLKQKINRKKTAFAELKKEALNLLIDE